MNILGIGIIDEAAQSPIFVQTLPIMPYTEAVKHFKSGLENIEKDRPTSYIYINSHIVLFYEPLGALIIFALFDSTAATGFGNPQKYMLRIKLLISTACKQNIRNPISYLNKKFFEVLLGLLDILNGGTGLIRLKQKLLVESTVLDFNTDQKDIECLYGCTSKESTMMNKSRSTKEREEDFKSELSMKGEIKDILHGSSSQLAEEIDNIKQAKTKSPIEMRDICESDYLLGYLGVDVTSTKEPIIEGTKTASELENKVGYSHPDLDIVKGDQKGGSMRTDKMLEEEAKENIPQNKVFNPVLEAPPSIPISLELLAQNIQFSIIEKLNILAKPQQPESGNIQGKIFFRESPYIPQMISSIISKEEKYKLSIDFSENEEWKDKTAIKQQIHPALKINPENNTMPLGSENLVIEYQSSLELTSKNPFNLKYMITTVATQLIITIAYKANPTIDLSDIQILVALSDAKYSTLKSNPDKATLNEGKITWKDEKLNGGEDGKMTLNLTREQKQEDRRIPPDPVLFVHVVTQSIGNIGSRLTPQFVISDEQKGNINIPCTKTLLVQKRFMLK